MLKCDEVAAQASDFLDQQMTTSQRALFRLHLMYCTNCRRFVRHMSLLKHSIQLRPVTPPSSDQVDAWMQQVLKQQDK